MTAWVKKGTVEAVGIITDYTESKCVALNFSISAYEFYAFLQTYGVQQEARE